MFLKNSHTVSINEVLEIVISLVLFFYAFVLSTHIRRYTVKEANYNIVSSMSPLLLIHVNKEHVLKIIHGDGSSFGFPKKLSLESFKNIFTLTQWKNLEEKLLGENISDLEDSGVISLSHTRYIRYLAKQINTPQCNGVLIWFYDISTSMEEELNLMHHFHNYRSICYELDLIINALPIPVWKREENRNITFCNQAYKDLIVKIGINNSNKAIPEIDSSLSDLSYKQGATDKLNFKKALIIDNELQILKINELRLHSGEYVGFCYFISDLEHAEKKNLISNTTIKNIIENNNSAIFIVNNLGIVYHYNKAFIDFFDLSNDWLSTLPTFSSLLDKMREKGKLPEVKNYKEYKHQQMYYLTKLAQYETFFMHLLDGSTLRVSVIPSQGGDTIFIYENISTQLTLERDYNEQLAVMNSMISSYLIPVALFSKNGTLHMYNDSFSNLFEISPNLLEQKLHFKEILELQHSLIANDEDYNAYKQALINSIESKNKAKSTFHHISKGNIRVNIEPLPDNSFMLKYSTY
jgi:PAS domain-containing protein